MASRAYRSSLKDAPVPKWSTIEKFMSLFQKEHESLLEMFPDLVAWQAWYTKTCALDADNYEAYGAQSGAIAAIERMLEWTPRADLDPHTFEQRVGARARSSKATGCTVDEELGDLVMGHAAQRNHLHRYTEWVATNLQQRQWLPLACQVPLWSDHTRTWADMIAYDMRDQRFVLIELKTGYDHNYDTPREAYDETIHFCERTPRYEHQLQLGWMHFAMVRTGHPLPLHSVVLRVSSKNGVAAPMPLMPLIAAYYQMQWNELGGLPSMIDQPATAPADDEESASSHNDSETELSESASSSEPRARLKRPCDGDSPPGKRAK